MHQALFGEQVTEQIDGRSGADTEDFARFDVGEGGFGGLAFGEVLGVHGRGYEGRIRRRQASRHASERTSSRSDEREGRDPQIAPRTRPRASARASWGDKGVY